MRTESLRNLLTVAMILLCGGIGYLFYYMAVVYPTQGMSKDAMSNAYKSALKVGEGRQPAEKRWRYGQADREKYWKKFEQVNITGKLPPEPEKPVGPASQPVAPPPLVKPLDKIFTLTMVISGDRPEQGGFVCLVYKPDAGVEPDVSAPAGPVAMHRPMDGIPGAARLAPQNVPGLASRAPDAGSTLDISDGLRVGDGLRRPHHETKLLRVVSNQDGQSAVFTRPGGAEETISIESDPFGIASIAPGLAASRPGKASPPAVARRSTGWVDPGEGKPSQQVAPDTWNISTTDERRWADTYDRSLAEDLHLEPYAGSRRIKDPASGKEVSGGLQVTRSTGDFARFGIQTGDLLIDLNGVPVTSKAQLLKVGKDMYENGTREFSARILSRGEFVTKTYRVADRR